MQTSADAHPSSGEPTIELILRAREGDEDAWNTIDERYRAILLRIAHHCAKGDMRRRMDTEDLVQSAFLAAFDSLDKYQYQGPGSLQAWLTGVLANRVRQGLRRHTAGTETCAGRTDRSSSGLNSICGR